MMLNSEKPQVAFVIVLKEVNVLNALIVKIKEKT